MFLFFKKICADKNQIFIRDFLIETQIGVNQNEKGRTQRVIAYIVIEPKFWPKATHDNINETVSYDDVVKIIHNISNGNHIHLLETLAEKIAEECLTALPIRKIQIRLEKPEIYSFAIPGVEITRTNGM